MPIPDYQTLMLPLLNLLQDGKERTKIDAVSRLAGEFHLSDEERNERFTNSDGNVFHSCVSWARTFLKQAGLLIYPKRGSMQITPRGLSVLQEHPQRIDNAYLRRFEEFEDFLNRSKAETAGAPRAEAPSASSHTPKEMIEAGYASHRAAVEAEILATVKSCSPEFFERLVVHLLTAMGYGGSRSDAGRAVGRSGDGGVDGVIKEDKLGIDLLYIQAKRWDSAPVGRPEIQKFVGALHGQKAKKGVFLTTSKFSADAQTYAASLSDPRIVLVDGPQLAALMFDHNLGVAILDELLFQMLREDLDAEGTHFLRVRGTWSVGGAWSTGKCARVISHWCAGLLAL